MRIPNRNAGIEKTGKVTISITLNTITNIASQIMCIACSALIITSLLSTSDAFARDVEYSGSEEVVYVAPGEPTQVTFPSKVSGGFKGKNSSVALERQDNYVIVFARPDLRLEGESLIVQLEDKRTYLLRVVPADGQTQQRDSTVTFYDDRPPVMDDDAPANTAKKEVVRNPVSKLMREMMLVAEFGRRKGVTGFQRSNRYSGETVLQDGAITATIDEIFMGSDLWGYVLNVENKLGVTQKLNPATFRLDGTQAVSAQRWELAPQPQTPEQHVAKAHEGKVYIVTTAKRR